MNWQQTRHELRSAYLRAEGERGDPARVADAAAAFGTVLEAIGEYAEAEVVLRRAVEIYQDAYGRDDSRLASPLSALGAACAARGRLAEAERLYRRALAIVHRPAVTSEEES